MLIIDWKYIFKTKISYMEAQRLRKNDKSGDPTKNSKKK